MLALPEAMSPDSVAKQPDGRLLPFLQSEKDTEAQHLDRLFKEHVAPILEGILRRKIGAGARDGDTYARERRQEEFQDLRSEIWLRLLARLREAKADQTAPPISDFPSYIAVVAYNAVHEALRKKYPQRYSLENKLRYLLQHQQGLALWRNEHNRSVGGFAEWQERSRFAGSRLQPLLDDPAQCTRRMLPRESVQHINPALLLAAIFNFVGHPVELDDLVAVVAELWGIRDAEPEPMPDNDRHPAGSGQEADPLDERIVGRLDLRRYWTEICQLPPKQCAALLLQAQDPDGNSLIELLEMEGIAGLREVAAAIDLPAEALAALWNDLPLEDARIAEQLGVTTQHVTRMRMMARRRIAERLAPLLNT
jgi:hypothetical protein